MAAITTIVAIAAVVIGAASYASAEKSRKEAAANYRNQAEEQAKARSEQAALSAQQAAEERRQQIREERVRRARVLAAAENTGTEGSSGEFGAISGFATGLGANIGSNIGRLAGTQRLNQYAQSAADFGSAAQENLNSAAAASNRLNLSMSIFSAAGGSSQLQTAYNRGFSGASSPQMS